jgi:hypothetical protein
MSIDAQVADEVPTEAHVRHGSHLLRWFVIVLLALVVIVATVMASVFVLGIGAAKVVDNSDSDPAIIHGTGFLLPGSRTIEPGQRLFLLPGKYNFNFVGSGDPNLFCGPEVAMRGAPYGAPDNKSIVLGPGSRTTLMCVSYTPSIP